MRGRCIKIRNALAIGSEIWLSGSELESSTVKMKNGTEAPRSHDVGVRSQGPKHLLPRASIGSPVSFFIQAIELCLGKASKRCS